MALNIETFKIRTVTALVFVVVMLAGIFWNVWSFISLFIIIMIGCFYEFVKLVKKINDPAYLYYIPLGVFYIVMPILMIFDLGIIYEIRTVGPPFEVFTYSSLLPCAIIFSIWINDTMAYLVGSFIGKTSLSHISPKKTWEGTIGGGLLCAVIIAIAGNYIPAAQVLPWYHWMFIAIICSIAGTTGDLLESKLKRLAGTKDSGSFMPGHGGFLDRFDSLLVAIPFVWVYTKLFI